MAKIVKKQDIAQKLDLEKQVSLDSSVDMGMHSGGRVISREVHGAMDRARHILQEAQVEANRVRDEAREILGRVETEKKKACEAGFAEGRDRGLGQVTTMITEATSFKERMFDGLEKGILNLVYDIAEKIIGRDLAEKETSIVDLVRQALHSVIGQQVVVLVNPQDLKVVKEHQTTLMQALDASKTIQIRADEKVRPKGCVIESEIGTIDAQLDTQLHAIKKALGLDDAP